MKDWQKGFYNTISWQRCRDNYVKSVGGLCEKCLSKGIISQGEIVHHKIHLNAQNITIDSISLNPDNLELLCRQCHSDSHTNNPRKRYSIGADGSVIPTSH